MSNDGLVEDVVCHLLPKHLQPEVLSRLGVSFHAKDEKLADCHAVLLNMTEMLIVLSIHVQTNPSQPRRHAWHGGVDTHVRDVNIQA